MTDDELEQLLGDVPLRRPTLAMDRRVGEALAPKPAKWGRLAIAAVLLLAVGAAISTRQLRLRPPAAVPAIAGTSPPATAVALASPVRVDRAVSTEVSDGVVTVTDNVPYERVRRTTVRETWYVDPRTGARVRVEVPTEEVVLRPAEVY